MDFTQKPHSFPMSRLKEWFLKMRRTFPWRENPTPYAVWISEVMLQQTRSSVVISYFIAWMKAFPTIKDLANASLEKVLKVWEGLGYYSRARFLHKAAKEIVEKYAGEIPDDPKKISTIRGIGPYTLGAIMSFAFQKKAVAVDGNVMRLMSRFFALADPIDIPPFRQNLEKKILDLLPDQMPWIHMEGLIELGALVCKKKPLCEECPIREDCLAFRDQIQTQLPIKRKKVKITHLSRMVAVIISKEKYLLQQGEKGRVMADLFEFPYLEMENVSFESISELFEEKLGLSLVHEGSLKKESHSFTRYKVSLYPFCFRTNVQDPRYVWKSLNEIKELPFSSGHRRILKQIMSF